MNPRLKSLITTSHFKFGLIAATLTIFSLFISLSAYLVSSASLESALETIANDEFTVSITGGFDTTEDILPGGNYPFEPVISNNSAHPMYVFVEITASEGLTLADPTESWTRMGTTNIFYYGSQSGITAMEKGSDSTFSSGVTVDKTATFGQGFSISTDVYAIQADNVDEKDPEAILQLYQGEVNKE